MIRIDMAIKHLSDLLMEEITPNCSDEEFLKVYKPFLKMWAARTNMNNKKYKDNKHVEFDEICRRLLAKTVQFQHVGN